MTKNEPKPTVTRSTVAGKNCAACENIFTSIEQTGDGQYMIIHGCGLVVTVGEVKWYQDRTPNHGTDYPPGHSWCPEFETMGEE